MNLLEIVVLDTWQPWAVAALFFGLGASAGLVVRGIRARKGDPRHGPDGPPTSEAE